MKKEIKVAVVTIRRVKFEPDVCLTVDNDIPSSYATVKHIRTTYFSEDLSDYQDEIYEAIGRVGYDKWESMVKVAPDEPWVDITPFKHIFVSDLTTEAVRLLSEALPEFTFKEAKYSEEVDELIRRKREQEKKEQIEAIKNRICNLPVIGTVAKLFKKSY